jgi:porin
MRILRQAELATVSLCLAMPVLFFARAKAQMPDEPVRSQNAPGRTEPGYERDVDHEERKPQIRPSAAVLYNPCRHDHVDIEALNSLGFDTTMPSFADSITPAANPLRRKMLCYDFTYRVVSFPSFTLDVRQPPVSDAGQVYAGQLPTWAVGGAGVLIADLKSLHLPGYQLTLTAAAGRANWVWAMPNTVKMLEVVLYKPYLKGRLAIRAGYEHDDGEFLGMQVGGNISSGSQGVYAVLPYEVGLSYTPLTSPLFTVRAQPVGDFYAKGGVQRSMSPEGELVDLKRDAAGFRFIPHGDGMLVLSEGGYNRSSSAGNPEFWLRGGYMQNTTAYANMKTNTNTAGNYCAFFLGDRQLTQHDLGNTDHGLYVGVSGMTVPRSMNAYTRYYELRAYQNAPFRRRPQDMTSVVASYTDHSEYYVKELLAEGKTAAVRTGTLTGSYSFRATRGTYIAAGISYNMRPAITPRSNGAILFIISSSLFF